VNILLYVGLQRTSFLLLIPDTTSFKESLWTHDFTLQNDRGSIAVKKVDFMQSSAILAQHLIGTFRNLKMAWRWKIYVMGKNSRFFFFSPTALNFLGMEGGGGTDAA
jgi:hypothetical protein